jgi:hypothetical protein
LKVTHTAAHITQVDVVDYEGSTQFVVAYSLAINISVSESFKSGLVQGVLVW